MENRRTDTNRYRLGEVLSKVIVEEYICIFTFLLRKEVIHPHVLVGIPCYDFTPVADPTFAGPLLKG